MVVFQILEVALHSAGASEMVSIVGRPGVRIGSKVMMDGSNTLKEVLTEERNVEVRKMRVGPGPWSLVI